MSTYAPSILLRTIEPGDGAPLSPEAARSLLDLKLSDQDRRRVDFLASLARAGELSDEQRSELDEYEDVACMLELLQSKARRTLQNVG